MRGRLARTGDAQPPLAAGWLVPASELQRRNHVSKRKGPPRNLEEDRMTLTLPSPSGRGSGGALLVLDRQRLPVLRNGDREAARQVAQQRPLAGRKVRRSQVALLLRLRLLSGGQAVKNLGH